MNNTIRWSKIFQVAALTVALTAILAHLKLSGADDNYKGSLAIFDRIFDLGFAFVLASIAFLIGRRILRTLALEFYSLPEEAAFSLVAGSGAIGLAMLGLGLLGLLKLIPVAITLVLFVAIAWREFPVLIALIGNGFKAANATTQTRVLALLFGVMIGLLILNAATPPHDFDEAIYHLSVAKQFVKQGRVYPMYDNSAGDFPLLIQMIYTICLLVKADIAAKLFSLILAVTCGFAVYGFCTRYLDRQAAVIALFAFFAAGMVIQVAVTARIDLALTLILFLTTYAMIVYLETVQPGWLYASALFAGFGLSVKYTAAFWLLLLGVMYLVEGWWRSRRKAPDSGTATVSIGLMLKRGIVFVILFIAVASPWYLKNLVWFHNPVYPFLTGEVAVSAPGELRYFTPDDTVKLNQHFKAAEEKIPKTVAAIQEVLDIQARARKQPNPLRIWEYFIKPDLYSTTAERGHEPNSLFLLVPLLVPLLFFLKPFSSSNRWLVWFALIAVAFYFAMALSSWVARYLLPIYPLLTIIVAAILARLTSWFRPYTALAAWLPTLAVAVALIPPLLTCSRQTWNTGHLPYLSGQLSRREFMHQMFYFPAIDFINRQLPDNATVMMLGAQMSYDVERPFIADVSWETTEWKRLLSRNDSLDQVAAELKQRGITHILFAPGLFEYAARVGPRDSGFIGKTRPATNRPDYFTQLRTWATFDLFRGSFLESIYQDQYGYFVFRLK
ncbi:MAG: glycosyltransferase family 39 protein [Acidobacteria bacterium]|nr:glycosyltransferase family 39 protein [Acidobacteriota bacterium]